MRLTREYGYSLAFRCPQAGSQYERGPIDMYAMDDPALLCLTAAAWFAYEGARGWKYVGEDLRWRADRLREVRS